MTHRFPSFDKRKVSRDGPLHDIVFAIEFASFTGLRGDLNIASCSTLGPILDHIASLMHNGTVTSAGEKGWNASTTYEESNERIAT